MSEDRLMIGKYRFRDDKEYQAGKRDYQKVEELKKKTDFQSFESVRSLYSQLATGNISFETRLGFDFDDEVFELYEKMQSGSVSSKSSKSITKPEKKVKEKINLQDFDEEMQERILKELKKKENIRKGILITSAVVAVLSLIFFGIYQYMSLRTQRDVEALAQIREESREEQSYITTEPATESPFYHANISGNDTPMEPPEVLPLYKDLLNQNKSLIGWVKIADTIIDYPVMQSQDNEYYLDHNFHQEYDKNGSIFLDAECSIYPRSDNLILYGHHMKSGKMFGSLQKYESESYYKKHKRIEFDTIYETGIYEVMYVFRDKVYSEGDVNFKYYEFINAYSEEEFNSYMNEMAAMSYYDTGVTAQYGDRLLTLSTCDYEQRNGRFVVIAKKITD